MMSLLAFIPSAIAARLAKAPPSEKDDTIAQLRSELCDARNDLRGARESNTKLLDTLANERDMRLQIQRDLIDANARHSRERTEMMTMLMGAPAMYPTQAIAGKVTGFSPDRIVLDDPQAPVQYVGLDLAANTMLRESMSAFICNCAPGRHELFTRPQPPAGFGS